MNSTEQFEIQEYKECVGKGCNNSGLHKLEILYIRKVGWFCDQCRDNLIASGLVTEFKENPSKNDSISL
jgi:hypothetical protein